MIVPSLSGAVRTGPGLSSAFILASARVCGAGVRTLGGAVGGRTGAHRQCNCDYDGRGRDLGRLRRLSQGAGPGRGAGFARRPCDLMPRSAPPSRACVAGGTSLRHATEQSHAKHPMVVRYQRLGEPRASCSAGCARRVRSAFFSTVVCAVDNTPFTRLQAFLSY